MKKLTIYFLLVLCSLPLQAQQHIFERLYISTDRDVYVAGDDIYVSLWCLDAATGKLSELSSIAYLELHSADGMAQTGKVALMNGRGAGQIKLHTTLPTGNYKLVAYTAQNLNEEGFDIGSYAKTVSIFNTLSSERVKDGVVVDDELMPGMESYDESAGDVSLSVGRASGGRIPVRITNNGKSAISVSVSVRHEDGLPSPGGSGVREFTSRLGTTGTFRKVLTPEYEGEIIRAKVMGADAVPANYAGKTAYISSPGLDADLYTSVISEDGSATFFTNNIYSDKDLVCEIEGLEPGIDCQLGLLSPFRNVEVGEIKPLTISKSMSYQLLKRSSAMQIGRLFASDTLHEYLPVRQNILFNSANIRYNLDDYTRFPRMDEVIVEFIPELRVRRASDRSRDIQVRLEDVFNDLYFAKESSLMLLDGVPVFDHDKIMDYDPMLVRNINIYPYSFVVGVKNYKGVVNFSTYKSNMPGMEFDKAVRIVSFQGASLPCAYTGRPAGDDYPDYRQTIYWHPIVTLGAGEQIGFDCIFPEYDGEFKIVVEGVSDSAEPVFKTLVISN